MSSTERVRVEPTQKRIRVQLGGETIADSTDVRLVWEKPYYPVYYFPLPDVRSELLTPTGSTRRSPSRGDAHLYTVKGGDRSAVDAARRYPESPVAELRDLVAFDWDAMDGWFEEDEEVFVHARDPYTRVDILPSSRHVRIVVAGETVAETTRPTLLFETGLPVRFYIPKVDVRMDRLEPTDTVSRCPYKGTARYWSVPAAGETGRDLVWSYPAPVAESVRVAGLVAFYDEKVDVYVDGELQKRPRTVFS